MGFRAGGSVFVVFGLGVGRYRESGIGCKAGLNFGNSETCESCDRVPDGEEWLQRHPEAGSSWPSWPKASHERGSTVSQTGRKTVAASGEVIMMYSHSPLSIASGNCR